MNDEKNKLPISPHEALLKVDGWLSLEDLLSLSECEANHRDEFFEELKKEIDEGKIIVLRANSFDSKFVASEKWHPNS